MERKGCKTVGPQPCATASHHGRGSRRRQRAHSEKHHERPGHNVGSTKLAYVVVLKPQPRGGHHATRELHHASCQAGRPLKSYSIRVHESGGRGQAGRLLLTREAVVPRPAGISRRPDPGPGLGGQLQPQAHINDESGSAMELRQERQELESFAKSVASWGCAPPPRRSSRVHVTCRPSCR